jgi:hypothetical protein
MTRQARKMRDLGAGRMKHRVAAWLAWSVWALCVALFAATVMFLLGSSPIPNQEEAPEALTVLLRAMALTYPTVGAFVASRRPGNAIGWILCGTGLLTSVRAFAMAYTQYGVAGRTGSLPGMEYAAWIASWVGVPGLLLAAALLLLVFPDGRLLDRTWWAVVGMAVAGAALVAVAFALQPTPWLVGRSIDNLFRVTKSFHHEVLEPIGGFTLLIISLLCGGVALLIRVDKGSRVERQQIKSLAFFAALMAVGFSFIDAADWPFFVGVAAFNCFPIGVGIAVMRYRLLDIDLVINRTLVYGSLTAILVLIYFGGVAVTQAILQTFTSQEDPPQIAVVVYTLVIAALFTPLRRRIQSFIDRRFYRRKYDARKTLETFSAKLRDETDLNALSDDLVGVVAETMQPAHASLWLRPDTPSKDKKVAEELRR